MASAKTGFRIDASKMRRQLAKLKKDVRAEEFKPELTAFVRNSLTMAAQSTPVRNESEISQNQDKQYYHRINYIPSYHELINPSLRVSEGKHWLYFNGKWIWADGGRRLSNEQWSTYHELLAERDRRMDTSVHDFIERRAQARFLYRRSWWQVGSSLRIAVPIAPEVQSSTTRRKPPRQPDKGYGQWRGGKNVLSVVVYNPFLEQPSRYKPFSGEEIIGEAMAAHEGQFQRAFRDKLFSIVETAMR